MATSFQNKLNDLQARLKAENDERNKTPDGPDFTLSVPSPRRPKPFGEFNFNPPKRPSPKGLNLGTGLPGQPGSGLQRRRHFQLPCSPQPQKQPDSHEIEQKYQEIMKASGILTLDGTKVPTNIDELETLGELGHGTCGHVVKMRHSRTNHLMAVKQMRRSGNREENKRIIMDLDVVLKSHDCPYIVQCLGTFITSSDVWICMELMSTCLDKLLKKLKCPIPEHILGKVAVATVNALNYLKDEHGVIHRDVKPSNILMDEHGRIKLCDFGISGRLVDSKAKTRSAGCAAYMAPERIDPPDPTKPDYDIRADVWSLGVSLVELATGEFPYKNCKTDFEVLTKVLEEEPPLLPAGRGFSMHFCMFVRDCLTKDYRKRPKYRKLLEHPYIQKYEKSFVNVAAWYANVMGIERPKAQIQQPPSYFARSESYAGHPGPSPLVTPLTTPSIDFGLSQPMFPMATSSPSYSDGWPSPQSSTSSRVDFSLSYSPSPSPSPSPSGPFNTCGDSTHLGDMSLQQKPMDCSQGRSPNYNQIKAFETTSQSCAMEVGMSQGSPGQRAFNMSLSQPVLNPGHATELNATDRSGFTFSRMTDSVSTGYPCTHNSDTGFADFTNMGRRSSTRSEPPITFSQGNGSATVNSSKPTDFNSHNRGFSLDFNQIGHHSRRISDNSFPITKSTSSQISYGRSPKQNNGFAMSMNSCHSSNPFNMSNTVSTSYPNNTTPTPTAKTSTNPFVGNPFRSNPFNNH